MTWVSSFRRNYRIVHRAGLIADARSSPSRQLPKPVEGVAISKPKPRRNRSNTIPNADKTIPAATQIIPVTLITRPIRIPLSAIADLLATLLDHLVGAGEQHRRNVETGRLGLVAREMIRTAHIKAAYVRLVAEKWLEAV
jgi:hypothetical protein